MKRIAFVVQRYGVEINGGAELHTRLVVERLAARYDIDVLTSCARHYAPWDHHYPPGPTEVEGVRVIRFPQGQGGEIGRGKMPWQHKLRFALRRLLPTPVVLPTRGDAGYDGFDRLRQRGPHCPELFEHLGRHSASYGAVVFMTAEYEPAARGVLVWGRRSVLVPLLHDARTMYWPVFGDVLRGAGAIVFNTDAERRLAERLYGIDTRSTRVAGLGIEASRPSPQACEAVLARHGLAPGYLVYVGRVDVNKGCRELVEAFLDHARRDPSARLVLVGQVVMRVPTHPRIHCTGFVSDSDRDALIAGASALVLPSLYESLSMVMLEALLLHTPVIVNGRCEVLAEHVRLSGVGTAYHSRRRLLAALKAASALPADERRRKGERGAAYVRRHYLWSRVIGLYEEAIEEVSAEPAACPG